MKILVSNDDGIKAPGLKALVSALETLAEVVVVAPADNCSGASNSLTFTRPLAVTRHSERWISVEGTPTDAVHLAITGLLDTPPDMVVAGINSAPNLGDDTLYSGTVAAAMEGRHCGLPAIALSMATMEVVSHYATAQMVAKDLVERLMHQALPPGTILNVNVPDVPVADLNGTVVTRLGARHRAEQVVPVSESQYWIGPAGQPCDDGAGTDFYAIVQNQVSVTPIQVDLTDYKALSAVTDWMTTNA